MRTKRVLIAVTALIACLAIGSATVATAKTKKKKITTTITLGITSTPPSPYEPYSPGSATYSGQVKAKGPSGCKKGRVVSIFNGATQVDGTVLTGPSGSYSLTQPLPAAPGTYTAVVSKRVITKKKGKKFICKAATSNAVVVP
ncbi:MAG: hypothetical protein ACXWGS_10550 [Solirubrobacterales bacterium]